MTGRTERIEDSLEVRAFNKFPIAIVRGKGSVVWDSAGTEYIDFMSGIGVALVGHCNDSVLAAIRDQSERLITCHGSYYNDARADFVERLVRCAPRGLERALLTNTGTESVEAAIKLARRKTARKKVVSMKGGFHGKTLGALSATWNRKYRDPFGPLLGGFEFAEYGDPQSLDSVVDGDTAAVLAEPIQGESGVIIPPADYFRQVREVCDRKGALLIFDEIQSGLGRTGRMWASEHWEVVPDMMTVSKGLGGGLPIGAALATPEVAESLKGGGAHKHLRRESPVLRRRVGDPGFHSEERPPGAGKGEGGVHESRPLENRFWPQAGQRGSRAGTHVGPAV